MRVALVQLDIVWEDPDANYRRAERRVQEAAALGARLVVLPEMFPTGFSMDAGRLAQPPGGSTEAWLADTAAGLGVWILAGAPVQGEHAPCNQALLVSPEGVLQRYTKLHPFSFAGENAAYAAGNDVVTWEIEGVRITPFICYDLRFPEPFRAVTDRTHVYVVIANWPERRRFHWQTLLRARAIENLAYVLGVNRVGDGGGLHYTGDSAAISPWGETLAGAAEQEAVLVVDIDANVVAEARRTFPVLTDRRGGWVVVG